LLLEKILDYINPGDKVGIKVHVGEAYNTRYLRHDYVHEVIDCIKSKGGIPTLIETQGLGMNIKEIKLPNYLMCIGARKTTSEHLKTAQAHGYGESLIGAPLKFIDGENGLDSKTVKIDGIHFKEVAVASGLYDFDKLIVISHFKGHGLAGFGGALKQLGIGCVTKKNKFRAHFQEKIKINEQCVPSNCSKECIEICPVNAISIKDDHLFIDYDICVGCLGCIEACNVDKAIQALFIPNKIFVERVIDNATAVLKSFGPEKIRYINFALEIVHHCDCIYNPGPPVIPDLGIFSSNDPVAIDKACIDAETAAPSIPIMDENGNWTTPLPMGVEKFHAMDENVNPTWIFDAAIRNKIGNLNYKLIKI